MFEQEYEMFEQDKILNRDELAEQESDIPLHDVEQSNEERFTAIF
jgi:hypothetical protein